MRFHSVRDHSPPIIKGLFGVRYISRGIGNNINNRNISRSFCKEMNEGLKENLL